MRSSSSLVFLFCAVTGAAFAACTGETVNAPADNGAGGAGGATSSSSATNTSASSTTAAATTSSSTGGGDLCEQACAHAAECDIPACNFIELDCADPAAECSAQCLLDATCDQIRSLPSQNMDQELIGCIAACQGGGGGGGGGDTQQCLLCTAQSRCLPDCMDDMACQQWLQCTRTCFEDDPQPSCFSACDTSFPEAARSYQAAYACACTSCDDACRTIVDPCNAGGGNTGGSGGGL